MKNNGLAIVGVVFSLLLVGWFATRTSQPSAGVKELKVPKIAADTVTRIDITMPAKDVKKPDAAPGAAPDALADDKQEKQAPTQVVLEKDGSGFVVSDGKILKKIVDDMQLKPLLDAIGEFATGDLVANKKEKLKDFEIDDDHGVRVVITTVTGKALDLVFGRAAKGGGTTVRELGKNDVFVARGRLGSLLKKEATQWRKKTMIDKKAEDFSSITIARADGSQIVLSAESKEEPVVVPPVEPGAEPAAEPAAAPKPKVTTTWKLSEPATLPAGYRLDDTAVGRVASSLATLRASEFDDEAKAGVGFEGAHTIITAKLKDAKELVLHLGLKDDKKRVVARVDGDQQVYLLAEFTAKNVDKGLDDLRDLSLFSAKIDSVKTLTFTSGKVRVVVEKVGADWSLLEPKTPPPDFDAAQIAATVAGALRSKGVRVAAGVDVVGGDPMIEVKLASGTIETLRFGTAVPPEDATTAKPDDKPREYYVKGADGLVYVVNSFTRTRYEKPTELFHKPAAPPAGMGGGMGGMAGLESLPPDVRKKLEASMKNNQNLQPH